MFESRRDSRRALLGLMGSGLPGGFLLLVLPKIPVAQSFHVPGPLRLLASRETCRQARRRVLVQPCEPPAVQAAHAYLGAQENAVSDARYEHQVRQDFVTGRVAIVGGWVVAETELALLSMIER